MSNEKTPRLLRPFGQLFFCKPALAFVLCLCLSLASAPAAAAGNGASQGAAAAANQDAATGKAADQAAEAAPTPAQIARITDPSALRLSPEAELLYYYLLLSHGMADNSGPVINIALRGLLKRDLHLPVFQDGVTILLARQDYAEAAKVAREGLAAFPGDPVLTLLLSGAYSENGQNDRALTLLEQYLDKKPEDREIQEALVRLYLKEGLDKKASEMLSKLPPADESAESEIFRAGVLASVGRFEEAKKVLEALLKANPEFFDGWLEMAYVAEREGKLDEAIAAYGKAAAITPDNADIWYRVALLHLNKKQPKEALEALEKGLPSAPVYLQAALRFAGARFYKEAEELVAKAAQSPAVKDEAALLLSMILQESSDNPQKGLEPLKDIADNSPLQPAVLEQKARIYLAGKEYAKAQAQAREGRKRYPERKELWGLEAYALVRQEKTAQAEKLLTEALKEYPGDEELLFSLGSIQDESGKKDAAMQTMEQIIAVNPGNYQALNYVGYTLAEGNVDLERALTLITAALEHQPDADYIVDSLAWVEYRLGRFEDAWKNINRCLELGGDDATIWEHYGDIALALDKKDDAVKGYEEAISRKPGNLEEVRNKLKKLQK